MIVNDKKQTSTKITLIYDMDGTLYQLDGINGGFKGSSLETKLLQNASDFISIRESNLNKREIQELLEEGLSDPVGLSSFLSERYGLTRRCYFEEVWNIDPAGIVTNYEVAVTTVKQFAKDTNSILLTSAPEIWQRRVLDFLGLENTFLEIFTGDQFKQKEEVFAQLAQRYAGRIISIGDQVITDILPAEKLGMETLLVNSPNNVQKLKTYLI